MKDGWDYGAKLGRFVQSKRANLYWLSGRLRKWKYHRLYVLDSVPSKWVKFIRDFIRGFKAYHNISLVKCESCSAVGIDYKSEDHGWYYHGYHIGSCPDCKETK